MQPKIDIEISKKIMNLINLKSFILNQNFNANQILTIIKHCEFVVGMRLHTIIYAAKTNTAFLGIVYDPKVKSIVNILKQKYYLNLNQINFENLKNFAREIILNKKEIEKEIEQNVKVLNFEASKNSIYCLKLLNKKLF